MEVQIPGILTKFYRKFGLMPRKIAVNALNGIPIIFVSASYDELQKEYGVYQESVASRAAASGAGYATLITVPDNMRYHVRYIEADRSAGDGTFTVLRIEDKDGALIDIDTQVAAQDYMFDGVNFITLEEGDRIRAYVNAITGDSTWDVSWYGARESKI